MKKFGAIIIILTASFIGRCQKITNAEYFIDNDPGLHNYDDNIFQHKRKVDLDPFVSYRGLPRLCPGICLY